MKSKSLTLQEIVDNFLFKYRNTPSTSTNLSPADRVFCFKPTTALDFLNKSYRNQPTVAPKSSSHTSSKKNVEEFDKSRIPKIFYENNEIVLYQNVSRLNVNYVKARIVKRISNFIYLIDLNNHQRTAHINQLKKFL